MIEQRRPHRIVIAGGGVGALEAALALDALLGDRAEVTVLTTSSDYVVRPLAVREPFAYPPAERYAIDAVLPARVAHVSDDLDAVDPVAKTVRTQGGAALAYDGLIVACGARPTVRYAHAITIDDRKLDPLLHGLIQDIEAEYLHRIAFVAPERIAWPLPLYELALLTAHRAWVMGVTLETVLVTPEDRPLEVFGAAASAGAARMLAAAGVELHTSAVVEVPARREIVINPGHRRLQTDRVISLPELVGPSVPGLPHDEHGFLPVDEYCRVRGVPGDVHAVGDAADYPIKHGGVAAQMAVTAAHSIAAGVIDELRATPLDPVLRGLLITGERPRYLAAHRVGGHSYDSQFTDTPLWDPPSKISTRYLGPRLAHLRGAPVELRSHAA